MLAVLHLAFSCCSSFAIFSILSNFTRFFGVILRVFYTFFKNITAIKWRILPTVQRDKWQNKFVFFFHIRGLWYTPFCISQLHTYENTIEKGEKSLYPRVIELPSCLAPTPYLASNNILGCAEVQSNTLDRAILGKMHS